MPVLYAGAYPMRFWRGSRFYQIAPARTGDGYIGLCNGCVVATTGDRALVARSRV